MRREIGSIFQVEQEMFGYEKAAAPDCVKKALKKGYKDYCMVSSGRDALVMALWQIEAQNALQDGIQRVCLLPEYTCDTVDAPFDHYGYKIYYYPVKKNLTPDKTKFEQLLRQHNPDVILTSPYYGKDTSKNIRPVIAQYRQEQNENGRNVVLIEDITQYIYGKLDYSADYYVASLRKWLPVPDGGIIISKDELKYKPKRERTEFVKKKWIAMTQKAEYLNNLTKDNYRRMQQVKVEFLTEHREAEQLLDEDLYVYKMSDLSGNILNNSDMKEAGEKRASNSAYLYENLKDCENVKCPLKYTGKEAPLYVPVYVKEREAFQKYMQKSDIYLPVLWPVSELITDMDKETKYIYDNMLAIPCDQRYDGKDMKRIVQKILQH